VSLNRSSFWEGEVPQGQRHEVGKELTQHKKSRATSKNLKGEGGVVINGSTHGGVDIDFLLEWRLKRDAVAKGGGGT